MSRWTRTIWTEARQITVLLGWPPMPGDGASPDRFFAALRAEGSDRDAARFLAQALPRYEAVLWAARTVRRHCPSPHPLLMSAVDDWLRDPSERHRRAAHAAAEQMPQPSPARLCALAAFASGGSLAPEDKPPFPAPKETAGRFAAGAVLTATADSPSPPAALGEALDFGNGLAVGEQEGQP